MRKIVLIFIFILMTICSHANEESKILGNQVLKSIFDHVSEFKGRYIGLEEFDETLLQIKENGFYSFEYTKPMGDRAPIEFGLTLIGFNEKNPFADRKNTFEYTLPLLDLKFVGYESRNKRFDLKDIMRFNIESLLDEQQKFMPYRLSVSPDKESFKIKEDIYFTVTMRNLTKKNIKVKDLNDRTLYFLYNNKPWGAKLIEDKNKGQVKEDIILKPDEDIHRTFRAAGFTVPKVFEIYGSYAMTYKGVNPTCKLNVKVIEAAEDAVLEGLSSGNVVEKK